jgi:hypothetical protein
MQHYKYQDYRANGGGDQWRFQWFMSLPYWLWTATCPKTNARQIADKNPPTEEQKHYADFEFCKPSRLKTRIWIEEPLDASEVQPEDKVHYKYVNSEYFLDTWGKHAPVRLRINNGDDDYLKKEYNMPFEQAIKAAHRDVELLLLSTSYSELLDVAYNLLYFKHDN